MGPTRATLRDRQTERTEDWLETFFIAWQKEARDLINAPIPYNVNDKVEARKAYYALAKAWKERK